MERTYTRSEMIWAWNRWMKLFTEDPKAFAHEWESVVKFKKEMDDGAAPSYGSECADYIEFLLSERA